MLRNKIIVLLALFILFSAAFGQNVPCDICGKTTITLFFNNSNNQTIARATYINVSSSESLDPAKAKADRDYLTKNGVLPAGSYDFATFDILNLSGEYLHFRFDNSSSGEVVAGCQDVLTDSDGIAKCTISTQLSGKCRIITVSYSGNTSTNPKKLPSEASMVVCDQNSQGVNAIGAAIADLASQPANIIACFPITLVLGLLLASMYYSGRNPLSLFDITTPKLPKGKKARMHKVTVGTNILMKLRLNKRQVKEATAALKLANARVSMLLSKDASKNLFANKVMKSNLSDVAKSSLLRRIALGKVTDVSILDRLMNYLANKPGSKYDLAGLNRELYLKQLGNVADKDLNRALLHSADLSGVLAVHLLDRQTYAKAYGFDKIGGKMIYGDKNILGRIPLVNKVVLYTSSAIASRRAVHGMKKDLRRQVAVEIAERMGYKRVLGKKDHYLLNLIKGKALSPFEWINVEGRSYKTRKIANASDPTVAILRKIDDSVNSLKERLMLVAFSQLSSKRNELLATERAKLEAIKSSLEAKLASGQLTQKVFDRKMNSLNLLLTDEKQLIRSMKPADRVRFLIEEKKVLEVQRQAFMSAVSDKSVHGKLASLDGEFAALYTQLAAAKTLIAQKEAMSKIESKMAGFISQANAPGSGLDLGKVAFNIANNLPKNSPHVVNDKALIKATLSGIERIFAGATSKNLNELLIVDQKLSNMMKSLSNKFSFLFGEDVKIIMSNNMRNNPNDRDKEILDKIYSAKDAKAIEEDVKNLIRKQYGEAMSGKAKSGIAAMMMDDVAAHMKMGKDYNSAVLAASQAVLARLARDMPTVKDFANQGFISGGHGVVTNKYFTDDKGNTLTLAEAKRAAMLDHMSDRVVGILDSHKQNLYSRLDTSREFQLGLYNGYRDWYNNFGNKEDRFKGKTFEQAYSDIIKGGIRGGMTRQGTWISTLEMQFMPYFRGMNVAEGDKIVNGKQYININGKMEMYKPFKREHEDAVKKINENIAQFTALMNNGLAKASDNITQFNFKDKNGKVLEHFADLKFRDKDGKLIKTIADLKLYDAKGNQLSFADFDKLARHEKIAAFTANRLEIQDKASRMGNEPGWKIFSPITKKIANIGLFAESVMIAGTANKVASMQQSFATQAATRIILQNYKENLDAGKYLPKAEFDLKSKKGSELITNGSDAHIVLAELKKKIASESIEQKKWERELVAVQGKYIVETDPMKKSKLDAELKDLKFKVQDYNRTYEDLRTVQKGVKNTSYYDDFLSARTMGRQHAIHFNVTESTMMRDPRFGSSSYGMYQMLATGYHTGQGMYEPANMILGHGLMPGDGINRLAVKMQRPFAQFFGQHTRAFFSLAVGYPVVSDMAQSRKPAYGEALMSLLTPWESFDRLNRYKAPRMRQWSEFSTEEGFSLREKSDGATSFRLPVPWTTQNMFGNKDEGENRRFASKYEKEYGTDIMNTDAPWQKWFFEKGYYSYVNRSGNTYFQSGGGMRHHEMFKQHYQNINKPGPPGMFFKDFETGGDHLIPRLAHTIDSAPDLQSLKGLYYKNKNANFAKDMTVDIWKRDMLADQQLISRERELAGYGMAGKFRPMAFAIPALWPVFAGKEIYDSVNKASERSGKGKAHATGEIIGQMGVNIISAPFKPFTKGHHKKVMDRTHISCHHCGRVVAPGTHQCPSCKSDIE